MKTQKELGQPTSVPGKWNKVSETENLEFKKKENQNKQIRDKIKVKKAKVNKMKQKAHQKTKQNNNKMEFILCWSTTTL